MHLLVPSAHTDWGCVLLGKAQLPYRHVWMLVLRLLLVPLSDTRLHR